MGFLPRQEKNQVLGLARCFRAYVMGNLELCREEKRRWISGRATHLEWRKPGQELALGEETEAKIKLKRSENSRVPPSEVPSSASWEANVTEFSLQHSNWDALYRICIHSLLGQLCVFLMLYHCTPSHPFQVWEMTVSRTVFKFNQIDDFEHV